MIFGILFIVSPNITIEGMETNQFGIGSLEALPVALLVWVIGMSLGGTTGYAINPARDLAQDWRINYYEEKKPKPTGLTVGYLLLGPYWVLS